MSTLTHERTDLFIGGAWQPSSDQELTPIICPATEEPFGAAPTGTFTDADRAIDAARPLRTSPGRSGWATRSPRPRASDRWSRSSSASAWKASSQPAAPKAPASLRAADVRRTSTGVGTSSHRPC